MHILARKHKQGKARGLALVNPRAFPCLCFLALLFLFTSLEEQLQEHIAQYRPLPLQIFFLIAAR
jgi:hypothetical protein